MTAPHVELGNTASDISSGANSFAAGLLAQRQRQQQIALQEALGTAQASHLNAQTNQLIPAQVEQAKAQTGDIEQQEQLREHLNQPADESDLNWVRHYWPKMTMNHMQGMTKSDVHDLVKNALLLQRNQQNINLRTQSMDITGGNQAYNRFVHHPDVLKANDAKDAFDNLKSLLSANTAVGYNEVFGSIARMALPNNARAVGQMLTKLSKTGILSGPYNANENVLSTLSRLSNTNGTLALTPEMRQEIWNTGRAMLLPHIQKYDSVKKTVRGQMSQEGLPFGDNYLESEDKFGDVRGLAPTQQTPVTATAPGMPQPPAAPAGVNPRFMPMGQRAGPTGVTP